MKTLRFLIFGWFLAAAVCQGQQQPLILSRGNVDTAKRLAAVAAAQAAQSQAQFSLLFSPSYVSPGSVAEVITPDIQALAQSLQNNPIQIFNYVHDHIQHSLYFGSRKGAELTYLEKSGNDFDQCALLVALLRAAGYTNCGYQFGWMEMPYDATDGTHNDLHHWLQLSLTNSNWNTTSNYLYSLIYLYRGYPDTAAIWGNNTFAFQRIWVTLTNASTVYYLDPSFKDYEPVSGINLASAIGVSSNALMTAAGGIDTGNYATNLNESAVRSLLTGYTSNLLSYIQNNYPNASVDEILSGWRLVPSDYTSLPTNLLFTTYTWGGQMPLLNWVNEPTNMMSSLTIQFTGTNWYSWYMPQLEGSRISISSDVNGTYTLYQDDTPLTQALTDGFGDSDMEFYVHHPVGYWNTNSNTFVDTGAYDQETTTYYDNFDSYYNIIYGFEPDWGWLQERQDKLNAYRQEGYSDTSQQVTSESLNVMGLTYLLESWNIEKILNSLTGVSDAPYNLIGRDAEEVGNGYYFDLFMQYDSFISSAGVDSTNLDLAARDITLAGYLGSALEHGVIEQLQDSNYVAVSTIKMLEVNNTNGFATFLATSNNWGTVQNELYNYESYDLDNFNTLIGEGYKLLIPQYAENTVSDSSGGEWTGYGFIAFYEPGAYANEIEGYYYGGEVSNPNALVNPYYIAYANQRQPRWSPYRVNATGADPVDLADGTFQVQHTDLSVGQPEPHGLTFGRYYNSLNRHYSVPGMAPGWVNNYDMGAQKVPAPEASLGGTTPAQMAPVTVAAAALLAVYNDTQPDPKNWMVSALTAKWAMDQFTKNGVSVQMGKDTVQFIQQPNGTFTPPANCTSTLTATNNYALHERHGRTFAFDSQGRLSTVTDQFGQSLSVAYLNSTSSLPQTVTDWHGRTLTFNYSGTPPLLSSVSDSTGRSVSYGYAFNSSETNYDLNSFTDPDGDTNSFTYDADHEITATFDALNRLVVTNYFDPYGSGQIDEQATEGNTNKVWQIFHTPWQTTVEDPAGDRQQYFFDDRSRMIGFEDAFSNLTQTLFDGQDHLVTTISPLDETNQFIYDGNNNLVGMVDPLGNTNRYIYDNQNDLAESIDGRGDISTFGYNSEFSLIGSTNGANDFVNLSYNSDGTLHTRTDSGGTTTYGYDSYGDLNSITYPNSLGGESFVNNTLGDPTSHTDARNFVTTFQYDQRRFLTNTIAPTNLTSSVTFDRIGNEASMTDARGNVTSNTWSVTRKLLTTTMPPTPQGIPVRTSVYDNRDWLSEALDPLQYPAFYTNDIAGRLASATDPLSRTVSFAYDADDRTLDIVNGANETNSQAWDARGNLIQTTDGAGNKSLRVFDPAGNEIILTNRNGYKWQFQFDAANRLTNTITPLGHSTVRAFNHQGLVSSIKDPATNTTTYSYDGKGRLTNRADVVASTYYSHDANNNLTSVVEGNNTNSWTYDAYNRPSSYTDIFGNQIGYRYDGNGNLTNLIYPGGKNVYYFYDSNNRLTNVTDWGGRKTAIGYDLDGRMTSIVRPNGTYRTISYDADGEATNILEQMANGLPIALFRYAWNPNATMQWEFMAPLPHTNAPPVRNMAYNADNELSTVDLENVNVDADGNLTYGPLTNDTEFTYTYDARNRLQNVGGVTNVYDALNNRIGQNYGTNSTAYVVNPNASLPEVLMRVKNGVTTYYVYGPGLLYQVTETPAGTNTFTYHYDYRGSTIALSGDNGLVTDRMEYSLYATMPYHAGTNDTPFLFNGLYGVQTDPNGLLYMRARYYNPFLCRFLNPDPTGFSGGLNFFAYANGDPISLIDPFGLGVVEGWGGATATWIGRNIVNPLNSVSTTSTTVNFSAYMAGSIIGGLADLLRLGQGTAYAVYDSQDGWDVAIGITQDVGRAAGLTVIVGGGLQGAADHLSPVPDENVPGETPVNNSESGTPDNAAPSSDGGVAPTQEGLIEIAQHLSSLDGGIEPANLAMYQRLVSAYEAGEPLQGIDANFYTHELTESGLMDSGMSYSEAHATTLEMQGIPNNAAAPAQLYQPSIIQQYSESFNPASHPPANP